MNWKKEAEEFLQRHGFASIPEAIDDLYTLCDMAEMQYKEIVDRMCEDEDECRKMAETVLGHHAVYGDSYGVPSMMDIIDLLISEKEGRKK